MALNEYLAEEIALDCAAGMFSRREALRRVMLLGVTAPAAAALLAACGSDDDDEEVGASTTSVAEASTSVAPAITVPVSTIATPETTAVTSTTTTTASPDSTAGQTSTTETSTTEAGTTAPVPTEPVVEEVRFAGPQGELIGLLAAAAEPKGAVLVIHENRGLTEHIRSIPPRLAGDGYTSLAIDLLSEEGGTAALPTEGDATTALGGAPLDRLIADLRAGLDELERRAPGAKLAAIGFCFGGGLTWGLLDAGEPRLSAAAPFYGPAPADADFSGSPNAAVLGIYAELDDRVNASQETARVALEAAGLVHEIVVVPGVDHAFFNDTGPRYNETAAASIYQTLLGWFGKHLAA